METEGKIKQKKNPRENAGIFSIIFFWWMNPLMGAGYKKDLELEDLYEVRKEDESEVLGDRLEKEWREELEREEKSKGAGKKYKPSLTKAIIRTFGARYAMLGLATFIEECFIRIFQPLFMGWLIEYFSPGSQTSKLEAYLYATGVVGMAALYTFTHHVYFFGVMHTGMKLRIAACSLLYRKALKLSNSALGETTVGQMVNLLSNDVNRFDLSVLFNHYLWAGPLQLTIVTTLLWLRIGPSALVGAVLLIFAVPLQTWVGKQFGKLRVQTAEKTDKRIRLMNEIVNGMKVIKMYTWEKSFASLVQDARKEEIKVVRNTSYYRAFNFSFFFSASRFILLATFFVYGLTGEVLTAEKAFLCLSMFNTVRLSMTLFFPFAISQLGETRVSINRIQNFLEMENKIERCINISKEDMEDGDPDKKETVTVKVKKATGKWKKEEPEDTLVDIDLTLKKGELVAVIGPVGSGKSSVIQAILGELPTSSGKISVTGALSYAPQEPWVFGGSIRQNILFGQPYNRDHYWKVVEACALRHDIKTWEFGDQTLVGERGVALSGGQKARVTLARAIYRQAETYLLDDPLSAVDAHVGKHLFENCIQGFLKDKAVILVTHQLQYLQQADEIIVLKQGRIQERGSFQHLQKNGMDFSSFLAKESEEDDEEEGERDDTNDAGHNTARRPTLVDQLRKRTLSEDTRSTISHASVMIDAPVLNPVTEEENEEKVEQKEVEELRSTGSVKFKVYTDYFRSGGNWFSVFFLIFINVLCQVLFSGSDVWLSIWTSEEEAKLLRQHQHKSEHQDKVLLPPLVSEAKNLSHPHVHYELDPEAARTQHYFNLGIYGALVLALCVISMVRTIYFFVACMKASVKLHNSMFQSIIRAPCRFFDTNPVGRILNRFSKDMGSMDELLPPAFFDAFTIALQIIGIMAVVFAVRPWIMIPTVFLGVIFVFLRKFYMCSARDIKRLEGISKSPIFSQLSTSLHGLTTIRAFSAEPLLRSEFDRIQDIHTSAFFTFISATRWFGVWLDWIVALYLACVVYSFLVLGGDLMGGEVGLAISSCIVLTGMLQWGVRQSAEVENLMTSVERVMEYSELEPEDLPSKPHKKPEEGKLWPSEGVIEFRDIQLRYGEGEKLVLQGVNFRTCPHEKVGIVGRTGAGKSSLVATLFRLAEPTGSIVIDGVEVLDLGLNDLRSVISIIPQDPLLFTGSLRRNLDPFQEHSEDKIWRVLQEVHLAEAVSDLKSGLETEMSEGGSNLSVGQRQLVCLARAVLRQNRILVLDEATANVDPKTDSLIQEQIRTRFKNCTVLTIAHRLHTIMDSDRILVLSDGKVVEFGQPYELLCDQVGVLNQLALQTGEASRERLLEIARDKYFRVIEREEQGEKKGTRKISLSSGIVSTEDIVASL